ncbi:MAG: NifU family protein [Bdellovibrionales bacterium]
MNAVDNTDILVRTLPTPNPYALKFISNVPFKNEGKATFNSLAECADLPLVRDLFAIPGVKQVHLFQNTLTVTHAGDLDDDALSEQVRAVIQSRYSVHDPEFGPAPEKARERPAPANPQIAAIEEILDRTIRPGLQADGGDIEVLGFENDELRILYQGACGGCPSAMMGTLDAIQGILRNELGNDKLTVVPE